MKLQKGLATLSILSLLGLSVACNEEDYQRGLAEGKEIGYAEGYDVGYDDGYDHGYSAGDTAGYNRAKDYFASSEYLNGFNDGKAEGLQIGYANGYNVGKADGQTQGYNNGYNAGKTAGVNEGYDIGYDDGYDDGYDKGYSTINYNAYNQGYADGDADGYSDGYYDGYADGDYDGYYDGYDVGYDDGYYDGYYGLSVGKTGKFKGYSNILSMVHNDLIDYSKIKAPKQTKRGLVADGKLLFSETSMTNKDTLKKSAAAEQYLVGEMASQVQGKFGLSAERSLKVAKAANHFRKQISNRALTTEDSNAYATEIIGADFSAISKAYESSMKGNVGSFNAVIEKAAEKNETSPENMAAIVTKLFI